MWSHWCFRMFFKCCFFGGGSSTYILRRSAYSRNKKKLSAVKNSFYPRRHKQGCQMDYFFYQKSKFGYILESLGMEKVDILHGLLEYMTAIWYILWQSVIVCSHLVHISHFGMFGPRKIWQPWSQSIRPCNSFSCKL
jgi:hypothetical protein